MSKVTANYDEAWKEALNEYLPCFLSFFYPQVYSLIDWSKPPESQEQELLRISGCKRQGKGITDKIFKVWFLDNPTQYFYLHIEIQSQYRANLKRRMYIYNYRIQDLNGKKVISLVVLGDNRPSWRPDSYKSGILGDENILIFHPVKLLDYLLRWDELESSDEIFAIIIMAHLKTLATTRNLAERAKWKWAIVQKIYEKGWTNRDIIKIFDIIDTIMSLSKRLQAEFIAKVKRLEQERIMPLISPTIELVREESELKGKRELVIELLNYRFVTIPLSLTEQVKKLTNEQLGELGKAVFDFTAISDLETWLQDRVTQAAQ